MFASLERTRHSLAAQPLQSPYAVVGHEAAGDAVRTSFRLSASERRVIALLAQGLQSKEIACVMVAAVLTSSATCCLCTGNSGRDPGRIWSLSPSLRRRPWRAAAETRRSQALRPERMVRPPPAICAVRATGPGLPAVAAPQRSSPGLPPGRSLAPVRARV